MKKALKIIGFIVLGILLTAVIIFFILWNHKKPEPEFDNNLNQHSSKLLDLETKEYKENETNESVTGIEEGEPPSYGSENLTIEHQIEETTEIIEDIKETVTTTEQEITDDNTYKETLPSFIKNEIMKEEWKHYLLLGVNDYHEKTKCDTIMIASVNKERERIVLTSIDKDLNVNIDGIGSNKLSKTYGYGGANLVMSTIQKNFGIPITNYFLVDFETLMEVIDLMNGVPMYLSTEESSYMKEDGYEVFNGQNTLSGKEALAYCKIDGYGESHTSRQYSVLMAMYSKAGSLSYTQYFKLAKTTYEAMYSDMKFGKIALLAKDVFEIMKVSELERFYIGN